MHVVVVAFLFSGARLGDASRLRCVGRFSGAIHVRQWNALFASDASTVFELRGERWLHSRSPRSLTADFAPRRCHLHEIALLHAALDLQTANAQRPRLREHDVFALSGLLWAAKYAQDHARAILLHLYRCDINIQCTDGVQPFANMTDDLTGDIIEISLQQSHLFGVFRNDGCSHKDSQHIRTFGESLRSASAADGFNGHCRHRTEAGRQSLRDGSTRRSR